ncbi:hypothetical protein LguiA_013837 [Lonicera macranthoides]
MSGRESYGIIGGTTEQQNSNVVGGLGFQSSMPTNMRLSSYGADNSAVYKPMPPPNSYGGGGDVAGQLSMSPNTNSGEVLVKRKRGRPRKYAPDGTMAQPALTSPPAAAAVESTGFPSAVVAEGSLSSGKKRGRPPGSGRKQQAAAPPPSGSAGVGFTPHVITVKAGEDVLAKLMSFSRNNMRAVCILSVSGAISNVTLHQAATSGGTVTYEGRFEILSLSGSFMPMEFGGQRSRTGGLSVSLSGPDGQVLGGVVAGLLIAASPVQVIVGSFTTGQKQSKSRDAEPKLLPGHTIAGSPPSRATLSESDGGPGSPLNQSTGVFSNSNPQGIPNMTWR